MQPVSGHPAAAHAAAQARFARAPEPAPTDGATADGATTDSAGFDTVLLSPQAQALVDAAAAAPGKSAQSPAHEARRILALDPAQAGQPFGRVVSQVARGLLSFADVAAAAADSETPADGATDTPGDSATDASTTAASTDAVSTDGASADAGAAIADALNALASDGADKTVA